MKRSIYSGSTGLAGSKNSKVKSSMHAATQTLSTGSLTGNLVQWASDVWNRFQGVSEPAREYQPLLQDVEFTHALVALAAKLVNADGKPSTAEYMAFRSLFPLSEGGHAKLRSLFVKSMNDSAPALQYARLIVTLYPGADALYREVLDRLLKVATADAALNAAEHELLRAVAQLFDVPMEEWRQMVAGYIRPAHANAYAILGATKRMSDAELRNRYMAQVRLLHPDRYQAAGASEDTIAMLSDKLAAINAAYESIMRAREMKAKK